MANNTTTVAVKQTETRTSDAVKQTETRISEGVNLKQTEYLNAPGKFVLGVMYI